MTRRRVVTVAGVLLGLAWGMVLPPAVSLGLAGAWLLWWAWSAAWRWHRALDEQVRSAVVSADDARMRAARLEGDPFVCPLCGRASWHPKDREQGYCGSCHWWTGDPVLGKVQPPAPEQRRHA